MLKFGWKTDIKKAENRPFRDFNSSILSNFNEVVCWAGRIYANIGHCPHFWRGRQSEPPNQWCEVKIGYIYCSVRDFRNDSGYSSHLNLMKEFCKTQKLYFYRENVMSQSFRKFFKGFFKTFFEITSDLWSLCIYLEALEDLSTSIMETPSTPSISYPSALSTMHHANAPRWLCRNAVFGFPSNTKKLWKRLWMFSPLRALPRLRIYVILGMVGSFVDNRTLM